MSVVLDAGSGPESRAGERFPGWEIVRLDSDPDVSPDVVGDIRDIPLPNETFDAVWCSHALEHLYEHEVPGALAELRRVLRPGGEIIVSVPDLRAVAREIVEGRLTDTLYDSDAGPIRPLDVVYGFQPYVRREMLYAHRIGFDRVSLTAAMGAAGFVGRVGEVLSGWELRAECRKPDQNEEHDLARDAAAAAR